MLLTRRIDLASRSTPAAEELNRSHQHRQDRLTTLDPPDAVPTRRMIP